MKLYEIHFISLDYSFEALEKEMTGLKKYSLSEIISGIKIM